MAIKAQPQASFDDRVVVDTELEELLEKREGHAEARREHARLTKEAQERVRAIGAEDDFRVGRFKVSIGGTPARHVEFDADAGVRIGFKAVDDSGGTAEEPAAAAPGDGPEDASARLAATARGGGDGDGS